MVIVSRYDPAGRPETSPIWTISSWDWFRTEADAAGGMINYYFGNKKALWETVVESMVDRFCREVTYPVDGVCQDDDKAQFVAFTRNYVRYCAANPLHTRIIVQASLSADEKFSNLPAQFVQIYHDQLGGLLDRLMAAGDLPRLPTLSFAHLYVGACQGVFLFGAHPTASVTSPDAQDVDALVDAHIEAVLAGFLRTERHTDRRRARA